MWPRIDPSTVAVLLGLSLFVTIVLFVLLQFGSLSADGANEWGATARALMDRSFEGPLDDPVPANENPRRPAVYIGLLIAGLLSFLYARRRQAYILDWLGAWVCITAGAYLVSRSYADFAAARFGIAALEVTKVAAMLFIMRSAQRFTTADAKAGGYWLLLPGLVGWLAVSGGRLEVPLVLAPGYVLAGAIALRAAALFAATFRHRMFGTVLVAASLTVLGLANLAFGLYFQSALVSFQTITTFLTVSSLCHLAAAFGMLLTVFEETALELQAANQALIDTQRELEERVAVDALTGCNNRYHLEQNIARELEQHRRYKTPMSLLFIDVDRLKRINDTYGHDVGDRALREVGSFLRSRIREADYVVRWGGDEFIVLLQCTAVEALAKVKVLTESFDAAVEAASLPPGLGLSIGHAEVPEDATELDTYIRIADQQMYRHKSGKSADVRELDLAGATVTRKSV